MPDTIPEKSDREKAKTILRVLTSEDFDGFYKSTLNGYITGHDETLEKRTKRMEDILDYIELMFLAPF